MSTTPPDEPFWETDRLLGAPYVSHTIALRPDTEGAVEAELVRLRAPAPTRRAVLYVHGFNDYFFQTEYAAWWTARGYDFFALDLRKYGRALREHQTAAYVEDVAEYFEELDAAWALIGVDHDQIVLSGHSTGGLVVALWAHERRAGAVGMVLNSPWLDMQGPFWLRTIGTTAINRVGAYRPRRALPRTVNTIYGETLHRDHEGEWDYDLELKALQSVPIYFGWLRAIRTAHARLHRGLEVGCPVLVLTSAATARPTALGEDAHTHDIVLEVEQIRRHAPRLSRHVTVVSIPGARHDVVLSRPEPRAQAYDELRRWLGAYVEGD